MSDVILFERGWKKKVRDTWMRKKIHNLDFRGIQLKYLDKICEELEMDKEVVFGSYCFRSMTGDSFQNYCDIVVVSEEGYKELERLSKMDFFHYGVPEPLEDLYDTEDIEESEITTSIEELIKFLDKFMKDHKEVYFRIGGENPKTCKKSDNWDYFILTTLDHFVNFGEVCRTKLNGLQCQYGSYYLNGTADYPNIGDGLRIIGDKSNYHSLQIHKDDVGIFVRKVKEVRKE